MKIGITRLLTRISILIVLSSCLFPSAVQGRRSLQTKKQSSVPIAERPGEIENLLSQARSLPAEFAIDILMRVQKSKRVDKQWRKEILEEAFTLTAMVQNDLRETRIPFPSTPSDTRAGYRSMAFSLGLDSLSIRSHVIGEMLSIDPVVALRMFNEISPKLQFKPRSCASGTDYDVADFYLLLGKISRTAFDEKKIQQGERVQFILPFVESLSSPVQIDPLINALLAVGLRRRESFIISQSFANALRRITVSDRSFSASLFRNNSIRSIFQLVNLYRKTGVPYTEILNNYRAYIVRQLQAVRCEDNVKLLKRQVIEINYFYPDNPLTIEESTPIDVENGAPAIKPYFESAQSRALVSELRDLRGYDDDPASREPYTSASWQEKMLDFLRRLEGWDGSSESDEEDYFHQKCILYRTLFSIAPAGAQSDQVLFSYLELLTSSGAINESRIEWLWQVNDLIRSIKEKPVPERLRQLSIIENSKKPVVQAYGALAKVEL